MNPALKKIIASFPGREVVVWGDFILDEYVFTSTGRVSREAPVLVTELEKTGFKLGGAGNVALNVLSLGARPLPVGLVGDDEPGRQLCRTLAEQGISTAGLVSLPGYRTPKKSRILSGAENTRKQQILRIDSLHRRALPERALQELTAGLRGLMKNTPSLIVSDYLAQSVQEQAFSEIRRLFPENLACIDSRRHLPAFRGATVATPNEPELKAVYPDLDFLEESDFLQAGHNLRRRIEARGLVLKRGHKGMIVFEEDKEPLVVEIFGTPEIVDVTGAGDTVLAVVSLALQAGASLAEAAILANTAGGIVVMKEGAYPISHDELYNAVG